MRAILIALSMTLIGCGGIPEMNHLETYRFKVDYKTHGDRQKLDTFDTQSELIVKQYGECLKETVDDIEGTEWCLSVQTMSLFLLMESLGAECKRIVKGVCV